MKLHLSTFMHPSDSKGALWQGWDGRTIPFLCPGSFLLLQSGSPDTISWNSNCKAITSTTWKVTWTCSIRWHLQFWLQWSNPTGSSWTLTMDNVFPGSSIGFLDFNLARNHCRHTNWKLPVHVLKEDPQSQVVIGGHERPFSAVGFTCNCNRRRKAYISPYLEHWNSINFILIVTWMILCILIDILEQFGNGKRLISVYRMWGDWIERNSPLWEGAGVNLSETWSCE